MRKIPRPIAIAGYTVAAGLMAVGGLAVAQSAGANVIDDGDGVFTLIANPDSPFSETGFSPGSTTDWLITADLAGTDNASLSLQLTWGGLLATSPDGLDLLIQECSTPWAGPPATCGGTLLPPVYDGKFASAPPGVLDLGTILGGTQRYFLANFSLPADTPDTMMGQVANFRFTFTAANDSETVTNLPRTGGPDLFGPILLGAGLVLGGLILARQRAGAAAELASTEGVQR